MELGGFSISGGFADSKIAVESGGRTVPDSAEKPVCWSVTPQKPLENTLQTSRQSLLKTTQNKISIQKIQGKSASEEQKHEKIILNLEIRHNGVHGLSVLFGALLNQTSQGLFISELSWWVSGKEPACNAGDMALIPGSGRSSREGNGNPLQCSCLENPMGRGAWWAAVHGVAKSHI